MPGRLAASAATDPPGPYCRRHYYTYQLSNSKSNTLYIPLTSYCNTVTLPQTRGPKFVLPSEVVASLCRVRDAEQASAGAKKQWEFWCRWLDQQEGFQTIPAPAPASIVASLPNDDFDNGEHRPPSVTDLLAEVEEFLQQQPQRTTTSCIVIGGEGEPTLRWGALICLLEQLGPLLSTTNPTPNNNINDNPSSSSHRIRIHTNGLLLGGDQDASHRHVDQLLAAACTAPNSESNIPIELSIPLMTHDPDQYDQLMQPLLLENDNNASSLCRPHERVQTFLRAAAAAASSRRLTLDVTAVARPDVDRNRTEALAKSLGATTGVRWRPYFE